MTIRSLVFLLLILFCGSCAKNEPGIEIYDHTLPLQEDITRVGSVELKSKSKSYHYFSHTVFPNFPTDFWLYDSTITQWIPKADFPGADRLAPMMVFYSNLLYMGLSTAQPLPDLNDWYSFDLSADLWSKKSSCQFKIPGAMEPSISGEKIIIGCAYVLGATLCPLVYTTSSDSWTRDRLNCDSTRTTCY